jgi:uncharacterized protein (DUF427 family)
MQRIEPGAGQESVWDYPRPPRVEPVDERIRIVLGGVTIIDTIGAVRVLETSHPPNFYVPLADAIDGALVAAAGSSACEWKGVARYFDVRGGGRVAPRAAWWYPQPAPGYEVLADKAAIYAGPMDSCWVGDEQVTPQAGGFYGGWITQRVVGPFKGEPGTLGW